MYLLNLIYAKDMGLMKNNNTLNILKSGRRRYNKTIKTLAKHRINRAPDLPVSWVTWFLGFLDGDGYLGHTKTGANIKWELVFNLAMRDLHLLYHIKDQLGIGVVKPVKSAKTPVDRYIISSLEEIIEVIMPLIEPYPLFTRSRYWQFVRARLLLEGAISKYADMPIVDFKAPIPNLTVDKILSYPYFRNYLVGFMEAELGLYINANENRASWSITQSNAPELMQAIHIFLDLGPLDININVDSRDSNNEVIATSSKAGIQRLIDFLTSPETPKFKGYKGVQFKQWCNEISSLPRYNGLRLP